MITKLILQNFQAHTDSTLELCPGINAIVGTSDSGKSSILRALRWLVKNQPSGADFKRHGTDYVIATGVIDDKIVRRTKDKSRNTYSLEGELFAGFGVSVPEPIRQLFNMGDINFQLQMDGPFLLSLQPRQVALELNKAVDLDIIENSLHKISKLLWNDRQRAKAKEADVQQLEQEVAGLEWVDKMSKELRVLAAEDTALALLANRCDTLEELINTVEQSKPALERAKKLSALIDKVLPLIKEYEALVKEADRLTPLADLIAQAEHDERSLEAASMRLENLREEYAQRMPDICPLCGKAINNGSKTKTDDTANARSRSRNRSRS